MQVSQAPGEGIEGCQGVLLLEPSGLLTDLRLVEGEEEPLHSIRSLIGLALDDEGLGEVQEGMEVWELVQGI